MTSIYNKIVQAKAENQKLLAILLDPDKIVWETLNELISKINQSPATHIFVGGSLVFTSKIDELIIKLKENSDLPVLLFPGNPSQISDKADGILFLSLISGRNPDYLIEHQVQAAPLLRKTTLEVIPTGYILIESESETAVSRVSQTKPMDRTNHELVLATAQAGEMLGKKLIYLEAGSGAKFPVNPEIISKVKEALKIPLIVGGGIKTESQKIDAYRAGADMIVMGTAYESESSK